MSSFGMGNRGREREQAGLTLRWGLPRRSFGCAVFLLMDMVVATTLGCGSHTSGKHPDASAAADAQLVQDTNLPSQTGDSAQVEPADAATSPDSGTDAARSPASDADKRDDRGRPEGGVSLDVGATDQSVARPDSGDRDTDALTCTAQQQARRDAVYQKPIIPFGETPALVQDFLTVFLSKGYIEEHFRFFQTWNGTSYNTNLLAIDFLDGCATSSVPGQIQWGVAIYQGKIRYLGPSREWRVLISEQEANRLVVAAGCDASNLELGWAAEGTPIPGVKEYTGVSYYPAWQTTAQNVEVKPGLPAGSFCKGPACTVHAATGSLSLTPGYCASPG